MRHRPFFGIALLFPYLLWGVSALVVYLLRQQDISDNWNFLLLPVLYYAVGIVLWFIPYTLLAAGMWIWSKNKSVTSLRKSGLLAPVLFSILIIAEYSIINSVLYSSADGGETILGLLALLIVCGLSYGYLLVGIALAFYKFLQSKDLIAGDP